jgi:hypothetical protein
MSVLAAGNRSLCKPPDLPSDNRIECPECQESPALGGFGGGARPEPAPAIDGVYPAVMPIYIEVLLRNMGQAFGLMRQPAPGARIDSTDVKTTESQRLFEIAEVYRRTGHLASARFFFQRVHLVEPTGRLGRLAMDRISEIESRLREAEESGADPESQFHDMRDRTMPLGLAMPETY